MTTSLSRRLAPLVLCVSAALGLAPAPAHAAPAAELTVSGLDTSVGQVQFFLAGRGLPAGTSLASGVTVEADGIALPARVETLRVATPGAPARGVVLVLDASGSMAGTAIAAARAAATDYSTALPADVRLGLVTVSTKARQALAPTTDRTAFAGTVGKVEAGGDTALYDGIRQATAALTAAGATYDERRVVVLSDGADTTSKTRAADAAKDLADVHATLDVVAYGAQAGGAEVQALAEGTGGHHLYPAADSAALRTIFRGMSGALTAPVMVTATVPPKLSGRTTHLRVAVPGGTATEAQVAFRVDPAAAAATAPQVAAKVATGRSRVEATRALAARTTAPELRSFTSAVIQASDLGVPIGNVLREQAREMRGKRRQRAEEQAQKVPIKILFPTLFCMFPGLFIVILGPAVIRIMHSFGH